MTAALENDECAGFAGPAIYYYDYNGHIDILSTVGIDLIMRKGWFHRIGNFEQDRGQYNAVTTVDFLEGSCLLIKKAALDKIGLFDSRYFAYWEETDLCIGGERPVINAYAFQQQKYGIRSHRLHRKALNCII